MRQRVGLALLALALHAAGAGAQPASVMRLSILQAEDRRAPNAADLALLRSGSRRSDPDLVVVAVRALGRLERVSLLPDILPLLAHALPEVRAEAANALAQAAQGAPRPPDPAVPARAAAPADGASAKDGAPGSAAGPPGASPLAAALTALIARLDVESDATVRAALCEAIGRLPYATADLVLRADRALVGQAQRNRDTFDRLGAANGLASLARRRAVQRLSGDAVTALRALAAPGAESAAAVPTTASGGRPSPIRDPLQDARVRRLALEALIELEAVDDEVMTAVAKDPDAQVRRLAMRGARGANAAPILARGLLDPSPMVRFDALLGVHLVGSPDACDAALRATLDVSDHIVLQAIDQLAGCGRLAQAVSALEELTAQGAQWDATPSDTTPSRKWHPAAHALPALASAAPARALVRLPQFAAAPQPYFRTYAARAAVLLGERSTLQALAADPDDNVAEAAIDGLSAIAQHGEDALFVDALARPGYAVVRAAAPRARRFAAPGRGAGPAGGVAAARGPRPRQLTRRTGGDRRSAGNDGCGDGSAGHDATGERARCRRAPPPGRASRPDHRPRRRDHRAGAVHVGGAGDGAAFRPPGCLRLLRPLDVPSRRPELRRSGGESGRERIRG